MKHYTVKKGQHHSKPKTWHRVRIKPRGVEFKAMFLEESKYILPNLDGSEGFSPDQWDWNKLCGLFFHPFNTRYNTLMIGWRYNPLLDLFELNFYTHVQGKTLYTDTVATAKPEDTLMIDMDMDYNKHRATIWLSVIPKKLSAHTVRMHDVQFEKLGWYCNEISHYFGGNRPAPTDVVLMKS